MNPSVTSRCGGLLPSAPADVRSSDDVIALSCAGRSLAKLNRHREALTTFQLAVSKSHASFPMVQALSYRELSRYNSAPSDVAARARVDLKAKLATFEGQLTESEFDRWRW